MTVWVIEVDGLRTMGIKLAKALGYKVITVTTSESKRLMELDKEAENFVVSTIP